MDVILEIFMEMLGTAIVEGGVSAASDRRRPKWLRGLVLAVLVLFFAFVLAVIFLVGLGVFQDLPLISLLLFALDAAWVFLGVRRFRRILRTFSKQ